jgi:hypothetical protein
MSLPTAPVAHANPLGSQVAAELSDRVNYYPWDRDLICGLLQGIEFGLCDRLRRLPDPVIGKRLLQTGEPTFASIMATRGLNVRFGKAVHQSFTNVYNDRQSKRLWLTINTAKLPFNIRLNTGSRAINQVSLQAGYPRASWHIRCNRQLRKQDSKQN